MKKRILAISLFLSMYAGVVFAGDFQLLGQTLVIPGLNLEGSNVWVTTPDQWNSGNHQLDFGAGPASNILRIYGAIDITMALVLFQNDLNAPISLYGVELDFCKIPSVENILAWDNIIDTRLGIVEAPNFVNFGQSKFGFQLDLVQAYFTTAPVNTTITANPSGPVSTTTTATPASSYRLSRRKR